MRAVFPMLLLAGLLAGCGGEESTAPPSEFGGAHVQGVVTQLGLPVRGAVVTVLRDGVDLGRTVTTDAAGRFCVAVPMFAEVVIRARIVPTGMVCETWCGSRTIMTDDFGPCGGGPSYEIVLVATPI